MQISVDENLIYFVQNIRDGVLRYPNAQNYSLGEVAGRAVTDINRLIGIDITGYKHNLKGSAVEHIDIRHGVHGEHDHSMADINNYGWIGYVLENYDSVAPLYDMDGNIKCCNGFLDAKGRPAPLIRYGKRVNGTFYVVEAVPETKTKLLQIVSAYKGNVKIKGGQTPNVVQTPGLDVRNESANIPDNKISNHINNEVRRTPTGNLIEETHVPIADFGNIANSAGQSTALSQIKPSSRPVIQHVPIAEFAKKMQRLISEAEGNQPTSVNKIPYPPEKVNTQIKNFNERNRQCPNQPQD